MKFEVIFKCPDATYGVAKELCPYNSYDDNGDYYEVDQANYEDSLYEVQNKVDAVVNKFVSYGELITIEFDTELGTATVVPIPLNWHN